MPPTADRVRIRLLAAEFTVTTNHPEVRDWLAALTPRAEQAVPVTMRENFEIAAADDEFRIVGDGVDDFELSATSAVETLLQVLHGRALTALPDHACVRAACGGDPDRGFLILGSGKSTLAVGLMLAGLSVSGDRLALVREGVALAVPHSFSLPARALSRFPGLGELPHLAELSVRPQEGKIAVLDPLDLGVGWRIEPVPVATIVWLEPNYGGQSRLLPCGKLDMARRVIAAASAPVSGRRDWVGDIARTVDRAAGFVLEVGELRDAVAALRDALG